MKCTSRFKKTVTCLENDHIALCKLVQNNLFYYYLFSLQAVNENSEKFSCVSYQLLDKHMENSTKIPSKIYKNVIIKGAKQNGLPLEYITHLEKIPDNGYDKNLEDMLEQVGKKL